MATYPASGTIESAGTFPFNSASAASFQTLEYLFDLDKIGATKLANTDVVNLVTIPSGTLILGGRLETVVAQVGGTGTCTLTLAETNGSTGLSAACSISAAGFKALSAGYACLADDVIKVTAAIGGGAVTKNPTIRVVLYVAKP